MPRRVPATPTSLTDDSRAYRVQPMGSKGGSRSQAPRAGQRGVLCGSVGATTKVEIAGSAFQISEDEPAQRVPLKDHKTP